MNLFQLRDLYNNYKLKVYLLQLNDFFKKYSLIKTFYSKDTSQNNNDDLLKFTLKICNQNENLVQLQLKFQLEFIQAKRIYVNFFDMNLNDACSQKGDANSSKNYKIVNKILNVISSKSTKLSSLSNADESIAASNTTTSNQLNSTSSNMKIHIMLPILISSLVVVSLVLLLIFLRK